jgi:predicted TIM-barrel fold metal-dependent hydrolase
MRVVSADDHIDLNVLPHDLLSDRLPATLRDGAPRVVEVDGRFFWQAEGNVLGPSGHKEDGQILAKERGMRPSDPRARLEDMDEDGVYAQVIYGPVRWFAIQNRDLKYAIIRAYNDWASEFNLIEPRRLLVLAQIPCWDTALAVEELERVSKLCFKGVQLSMRDAEARPYDASWETFWATAETVGMPVSFHLGGGQHSLRSRAFSWEKAAASAVVPMQLDEALAGMTLSGMCERHPKLRLVLGESGLGWVPYVLERLDYEYRNYYELIHDYRVKRLPSEIFRSQVFLTYQQDLIGLKLMREIGAGNVMWASDYPHGDSTWPNSRKAVDETLAALSIEDGRRVVSENALALYMIK